MHQIHECGNKIDIGRSVTISQQTLLTMQAIFDVQFSVNKLSSRLRSMFDRNKNNMAATARYRLLCESKAMEWFLMAMYLCHQGTRALASWENCDDDERKDLEKKLSEFREYFGNEPHPWKTLDWLSYRDKLDDLRYMVVKMIEKAKSSPPH